jgi:hypothetical protein
MVGAINNQAKSKSGFLISRFWGSVQFDGVLLGARFPNYVEKVIESLKLPLEEKLTLLL